MASDVTAQAKQTTSQAAERARTAATENGGKVIARSRVAVDRQSTVAGEQVNTIAQRARLSAAELRRSGEEGPAKLAESAADRVQQVGDWLKGLDADQLADYAKRVQPGKAVAGVEGFARSRPFLALAAGTALGFLPSRLLKAASAKRYSAAGGEPRPAPAPAPLPPAPQTSGSSGTFEGTTTGVTGGTSLTAEPVDVVETSLTNEPPLRGDSLPADAEITWRGTVDPPR